MVKTKENGNSKYL